MSMVRGAKGGTHHPREVAQGASQPSPSPPPRRKSQCKIKPRLPCCTLPTLP